MQKASKGLIIAGLHSFSCINNSLKGILLLYGTILCKGGHTSELMIFIVNYYSDCRVILQYPLCIIPSHSNQLLSNLCEKHFA